MIKGRRWCPGRGWPTDRLLRAGMSEERPAGSRPGGEDEPWRLPSRLVRDQHRRHAGRIHSWCPEVNPRQRKPFVSNNDGIADGSFVGTLAGIPDVLMHYRGAAAAGDARRGWGTNALVVIGGTAGDCLAIPPLTYVQGYNQLASVGVGGADRLRVGLLFNTRELSPELRDGRASGHRRCRYSLPCRGRCG